MTDWCCVNIIVAIAGGVVVGRWVAVTWNHFISVASVTSIIPTDCLQLALYRSLVRLS